MSAAGQHAARVVHAEPHPLAGRTVTLNERTVRGGPGVEAGVEYRVEDYWDRVYGQPWGDSDGNPAALVYAMRIGRPGVGAVPLDNEVVYGKVGGSGALVHVTELGEPT